MREVIWNGRRYRPKDRLNTCYMVMQEVNHQLFTETVLDEVLISMEKPDTKQAEEILSRLDLFPFRDRHPMSLSGGQKQRVAIASAIASKRSILFFDEPTSGLDYRHMKEVAAVLRAAQHGRRHCLCDHTRSGTAAGLLHGHHPFRPGKHCRPISYGCGRPFKGLRLFYGKRRLKCGAASVRAGTPTGTCELLLEYRCKLSLIGIANLLRDFCNGAAGVR